jgi:hypothetical protein
MDLHGNPHENPGGPQDKRNPYVVPELQVLRGRIQSMFTIYKRYLSQLSPAVVYFHKSQVSFSSLEAKRRWMVNATALSDRTPDKKSAYHQMWGGAIDVGEMESADSYASFLCRARNSGATVWTALCFTYDKVWHYWGVVLRHDPARKLVEIYLHSLEAVAGLTHKDQLASQRRLQRACRAQKWRTITCIHKWGQCADIDDAFGWTRLWVE